MLLPVKLTILAMVMLCTTAQLNIINVFDKDAMANVEDTVAKVEDSKPEPPLQVDITGQVSKPKIQDSKLNATIGTINFAGKAIKSEDGILGILNIAGEVIKANLENSKAADDNLQTFNITGLSDKSVDGTIRTVNITGKANKSDNDTLRTITITGKAIKSDHATLGVVNITEDATKSNDTIVRAYNITGKVFKTDLLNSVPVDGTLKEVNFNIMGTINNRGLTYDLPEKLSSLLNGLCKNVMKLSGVIYDKHVGGTVDLDMLTMKLFTNKVNASVKLGTMASLLNIPGYNNSQPLVIFMHGFIDDPKLFNFPFINKAFHKHGYFNILALDASPLIRYLYLRSSYYVQLIGQKLGATLATMVKAGLNPKDIYLVGHSLGAHIAGFTGKNFHKQTGSLVGRITGLDPAGPCFSHVDEKLRLQATDAEFVDVIHTDGGVYGLTDPVGHVDYYPNGGKNQPNCIFHTCSHNRVVELFAASVMDPYIFPARACKNWKEFEQEKCSNDFSLMGYGSKRKTRGVYFQRTGDKKPYGLGEKGLAPNTFFDYLYQG